MSDYRWRLLAGPLLAVGAGAIILGADWLLFPLPIPIPGTLVVFAVLFAAYVGGAVPGVVSAGIATGIMTLHYLEPGLPSLVAPEKLLRLTGLFAVMTALAMVIGVSQTRARRALQTTQAANRALELARVALDQVDYGVILLDKDLRAQLINPAAFTRAGLRPRAPEEKPTYDEIVRECAVNAGYVVDKEKLDEFVAQRVAFVRMGNPIPLELRMADGTVARFKCIVLPDGGRMLTYTDVTDLTRKNDELEDLRTALDKVDNGTVLLDGDLRVKFMNRAVARDARLKPRPAGEKPAYAEVLREFATGPNSCIPAEGVDEFVAERVEFVRSGNTTPLEVRTADGTISRFKCTVLPDGGRILTYTDVTDLTRQGDQLRTLRAALDTIAEGVMLLDKDLRTTFMNRAIREIGSLREPGPDERPAYAEILQQVRDNNAYGVPADQVDAYVAQRIEYVRSGNPSPIELRMAHGMVLRFSCTVLPDGGRMLIYANITDLARNAEQLERLATTDGMTGLYNRRQFMSLAEAEWSRALRHGRPLTMLLLDIDFFKSTNDRFGHDVGDQVILRVADLCRSTMRISDTCARLGGEEFALLLPETSLGSALAVAERLRKQVEASPLATAGGKVEITVSIGVAEANPGMTDILGLLKEADRALYRAKAAGRNRIERAAA